MTEERVAALTFDLEAAERMNSRQMSANVRSIDRSTSSKKSNKDDTGYEAAVA